MVSEQLAATGLRVLLDHKVRKVTLVQQDNKVLLATLVFQELQCLASTEVQEQPV